MNFFIHFLLISSLSIIIAERVEHLENAQIENFIREDPPPPTGLPSIIKLLPGGEIFRQRTVVWKGKYKDTVDVAIKIFNIKDDFERETAAYEKLNATAVNFNFMEHRIPRVYYCGPIFGVCDAIVMTLFDDSIESHFKNCGYRFSDLTILLIFKQVVEALNYIHSKGVLHNSFLLRNIYIHGQRIFVAGFDTSHLDETESLMWDYRDLTGIVWRMVHNPDKRTDSLDVKLASFTDSTIRQAFRDILTTDNIQIENITLPDYGKIIEIADKTLTQIAGQSRLLQFDWLQRTENQFSSGEFSRT